MSYSLCRASLQVYSSSGGCHAKDEVDSLLEQDLIVTPFQVKCRSQSFVGDISLDLSFDPDGDRVHFPFIDRVDRKLCDVFNEWEPTGPLPTRVDPDHRHLMESTTTTINDEQHSEVSSDFSADDLLGLLSLSVLSNSDDSDTSGRQSFKSEASVDDDNLSISPIKWDTEDTEDEVLQAIFAEDWENNHAFMSDGDMAPGPPPNLPPMARPQELFSPDSSLRLEQLCPFPNKARVHTNQDSPIFQTSKTPLLPKTTNTSSFASKQHQSSGMSSEKTMSSSRDTNRPNDLPNLKGLLPKRHESMNTLKTGTENDENKKPIPPLSHLNAHRAPFPCSPLKRTSPLRQPTADVISNNKHPARKAPAYQSGSSRSSIKDIYPLSHVASSGLRYGTGYNMFGATTPQVPAHTRACFEYVRGDHEQGQRDMWRFEYKGRTAPAASGPHRGDTNEPGEWKLDMSRYAYKGRTSPSAFHPQRDDVPRPEACKRDMSHYVYTVRPATTSALSHGAGYRKGHSHAPGDPEHGQRDMWRSEGRTTPSASDSHRGEIIQPGEWKRDIRKSTTTSEPQLGDASMPAECKRDTWRLAYKVGSARTGQKRGNVSKVDDLAVGDTEKHPINLTSRVLAASCWSPGGSTKQPMCLPHSLNTAGTEENLQATCNVAPRGTAGDDQTLDSSKVHEANNLSSTLRMCTPKTSTRRQRVDTPHHLPIAPQGTAVKGHEVHVSFLAEPSAPPRGQHKKTTLKQLADNLRPLPISLRRPAGKAHEAHVSFLASPKGTPKRTTSKQLADTLSPLPLAPCGTAGDDRTLETGKSHEADLLSPSSCKRTPKTKTTQQWVDTPHPLPSDNHRITRSTTRDGLTPEPVLASENAPPRSIEPSHKKRTRHGLPCSDLSSPIQPRCKKAKV
jgi:hypothetical protein